MILEIFFSLASWPENLKLAWKHSQGVKINNCSHFDPWGRVGIAFNIAINRGRYYEKIDRKVGTHVETFSNSKIFNFSKRTSS